MTKDQKTKEASQELARFMLVLSCQNDFNWRPQYDPATHAVRGETPRISVTQTLPSQLLQRRAHALSRPEALCFPLALYNPLVWEFHEQHLLYPSAKQHPLASHSKYSAQAWPSTTETYRIAKRLGLEKLHPKLWIWHEQINPHRATLDAMLDGGANGQWTPTAYQRDNRRDTHLKINAENLNKFHRAWLADHMEPVLAKAPFLQVQDSKNQGGCFT